MPKMNVGNTKKLGQKASVIETIKGQQYEHGGQQDNTKIVSRAQQC